MEREPEPPESLREEGHNLARIPFAHPATIDRFGGGQLPLPGGIAFGPDGNAYVAIGSADPTPNAGAVVRVATTG